MRRSFSTPITVHYDKMLRSEAIKNIPQDPGVYVFKDRSGKILYIGKAKNLNRRLSSYFGKVADQAYKVSFMLTNADSIEHIITGTEKEALILEGNLIKRFRPRYNVKIKDDANYPLLKLDRNNRYPRLAIVRRMKNDGALYFGPFTSASAVRSTLRLIGPVFPLRKCRTKEIPGRSRPCLNYQLGRCLAPCCLDVSIDDYQEIVEQVKLFLEGRNKELISQLREMMQKASGELNFEKAARIRDQIRAVEKTVERQTVVSTGGRDQDIIGLSRSGKEAVVVMLFVRSGYMVGSRNYSIHCEWENSGEALEAFLKQYYRDKEFVPSDIVLSDAIDDRELISEWLTGMGGKKVSLSVPSKGDKKKLVNMAVVNAENILSERQQSNQLAILDEAKSILHVRKRPGHIEGIDISNLRGDLAVASLVAFVEGLPQKSDYRNYRVRGVKGIDDYAMIAEVLGRRLKRGRPPDLFVIDGGKGHLSIALKTMDELCLNSPPDVVSIAKADQRKPGTVDRIYLPNRKNPLILPRNHPVLSLLMRVRDETHRRAVSYYRKRRAKKLTESELDMIPGVGPKRKMDLLKYFGDIRSLAEAQIDELSQVPGVNQTAARSIFDYFHKNPSEST
jgi:excinuclease ABC subunit C